MNEQPSVKPKLFMLLLGSKAPARIVEQHDYFFCIGTSLKELVPQIKAFWPEAGNSIHIDGWREVTMVDGYKVEVIPKGDAENDNGRKLFFINLGGYQSGKLQETHYVLLTVQDDRVAAMHESKQTEFFRTNSITKVKGANSHIDEKYGIDVDEVYRIDEILSPALKAQYHINITPAEGLPEDNIQLGYFKLNKL